MLKTFVTHKLCFWSVGLVMGVALIMGLKPQAIQAQSPSPAVATASVQSALPGPHFYSGETVVLTEDVSGDVYVAAKEVRIENTIDGDLLVAGQSVTITGTVTQDVRAAAANLDVRGMIGGNLSAAAATLTFDRQSQIGGSVVSAAGTTNAYGQIVGNAWMSGSAITIAGQLAGNADIKSEKLDLQSGTSIAGNVNSVTSKDPKISNEVQILGEQNFQKIPESEAHPPKTLDSIVKTTALLFVLLLVVGVISGGVILAFFPRVAEKTSSLAMTRPIASFGLGLSYLILSPVAALLLILTIVALPLGIIWLLLYGVSLLVGGWITAFAIGRKLLNSETRTNFTWRFLQFGLGLMILTILEVIPVIGWFIKLMAIVVGMGALILALKNSSRSQEEMKVDATETSPTLITLPMAEVKPVKAKKVRKATLAEPSGASTRRAKKSVAAKRKIIAKRKTSTKKSKKKTKRTATRK